MADFDAICRGLAANLAVLQQAAALEIRQVCPYLLDEPAANAICVAGLELADFDVAFRSADGELLADQYDIVVEACLQKNPDIEWQKTLRKLLAATGPTSLRAAVEANKLTSRMADDGTVTTNQEPACDALHVTNFRGQSTFTTPGGVQVALAEWTVRVLT